MSAVLRGTTLGVAEAARRLGLHPFEVVRILVSTGALPADLRLSEEAITTVRDAGKLETWWDAPAAPQGGEKDERAQIRALLRKMIERDCFEPAATRADNLFRGLDNKRQPRLRHGVNALIQHGCLYSHMTATGLVVGIRAGMLDDVRVFAYSGAGPVDRLWDLE